LSGVQPVLSPYDRALLRHAPRRSHTAARPFVQAPVSDAFRIGFETPVLVIVFLLDSSTSIMRGVDTEHGRCRPYPPAVRLNVVARLPSHFGGLHPPSGTGCRCVVGALAAARHSSSACCSPSPYFRGRIVARADEVAVATAIGLLPAFAAARLLRVGRFATVTHR
jgi:hypothetical protein